MSKKKIEDSETEISSKDNADDAVVAENSEGVASEENSSVLDSVAQTVGSAIGSAIATLSNEITSVVSSIGSDATSAKLDGKKHHSKRAERIGIVQSDKMTKTVTVRVDRQVKHPIYRKYIKRRKNFMAHDEYGSAVGDKVRIIETRPMSARKRWRVVEIIQKAVK